MLNLKKIQEYIPFFFKLTHCNLISCILYVPIRANVCVNQVHVPNMLRLNLQIMKCLATTTLV